MKKIKLTQGKFALVNDEDFEELNKYKWYAHNNKPKGQKKRFYAMRALPSLGKKNIRLRMHRFLLNAPTGVEVDHRDENGLNNQKDNLRLCTHAQNAMNSGKKKNNTSGFKGVSWKKGRGKYEAFVFINYKKINLGLFSTKEEAYKAYCEAGKKYHGEFFHP